MRHLDFPNIHETFHPMTKQSALFLKAQENVAKIDHGLDHKNSFNKNHKEYALQYE